MSTDKTGGRAFPRSAGDYNGSPNGNVGQTGMTLRDYFAAKAMQGMGASEHWSANFDLKLGSVEQVAEIAYRMADAMLSERTK